MATIRANGTAVFFAESPGRTLVFCSNGRVLKRIAPGRFKLLGKMQKGKTFSHYAGVYKAWKITWTPNGEAWAQCMPQAKPRRYDPWHGLHKARKAMVKRQAQAHG